MEKIKNNKSGITLVALVVTVIILLIISGVTIGMVIGNHGIIGTAGDAKNTATGETKNTEIVFNDIYKDIVSGSGGTVEK